MSLKSQEMLFPVTGNAPGGDNVEYEPGYQLLEIQAVGTPPQEMGECVVPGKDPDIRSLQKNCETLWQTSRDLRVAVYWAYSKLSLEGFEGFLDGLKLISGLADEFWETMWPELDPDDNDPTERVNILRILSPAPSTYADALFFIHKLRVIRLVESKPYTVRDAMVAEGVMESEEVTVDPALLNAEMLTVPASEMEEKRVTAEALLTELTKLEEKFNEKMGDTGYIEFSMLRKELEFIRRFYSRYSSQSSEQAQGASSGVVNTVATPSMAAAPITDLSKLHISKRSDALLLLKKCAEYFQNAEPTSPLPFLIHRALRMADMNFIELLGEIDQNALDRGREQLGVPRSDNY